MVDLTTIIRTTFYVALAAFFVFIILFTVHYTVYPILSFSPGDGGWIPIPTPSDAQDAFKGAVAGANVSAGLKDLKSSYTVSMDVYLTGEFVTGTAPRPLLYRGATALAQHPETTTSTAMTAVYGTNSNFVLWLDPTKNDLFASVFTGTATKTESRSTPVENLPIRRPFRLTAVFASRFVEIYVNGRLRLTHVLTTTPADVATGNIFNGSAVTARVANLKYWAYPLTARQVGAQASTPVATATLMAK